MVVSDAVVRYSYNPITSSAAYCHSRVDGDIVQLHSTRQYDSLDPEGGLGSLGLKRFGSGV